MPNALDILVENLRETFRTIETFLRAGLTAGLVLLLLAITNRTLSGDQKLPIADMNAPSAIVALVTLGTWIASGAFAAFFFATRRRIIHQLLQQCHKADSYDEGLD